MLKKDPLRNQRGQSIAEFALIAPIFIALIAMMMIGAQMMMNYFAVQMMTATIASTISKTPANQNADFESLIRGVADRLNNEFANYPLIRNVNTKADDTSLSNCVGQTSGNCTIVFQGNPTLEYHGPSPSDWQKGKQFTIRVHYHNRYLFPVPLSRDQEFVASGYANNVIEAQTN